MDWFMVGAVGSMPLWLVCGNILGTICGRFTPPQPAAPMRLALPERVVSQQATAHRVPEPVAVPVIVNIRLTPGIAGWIPRPDVIDGRNARELAIEGEVVA